MTEQHPGRELRYWRDLLPELLAVKEQGDRLVFTNGVFDILHAGHVAYLEAAAKLGDRLVIGLNSDDSVRRLKGSRRPLVPAAQRGLVLQALRCVDFVALFDEDTPREFVAALLPQVLVKGADYTVAEIAGSAEVLAAGGSVETIELVPGVSTTALIENILATHDRNDRPD